jgi:hypothetical protein
VLHGQGSSSGWFYLIGGLCVAAYAVVELALVSVFDRADVG